MKHPNPERFVVTDGIPICTQTTSACTQQQFHHQTHHCTLGWRVPPGLIIAREYVEMAPPHKLLVIQAQKFEFKKSG
jgi:hypothetical protein